MTESKKNHHFVPRALLKNWYSHNPDENNGFKKYVRNNENKFVLHKKIGSVNSTGSEIHLNTTHKGLLRADDESIEDTNTIENELEKLDDKAIKIINLLKETENLDRLSGNNRELLSKFIISLFMRHPQTINIAKNMVLNKGASEINIIENATKNINRPEQKDELLKTINLTSMLYILNKKETYSKVLNMKWELVQAKDIEFFSGHKPLVINFGVSNKKFEKAFGLSLSPKLLLVGMEKNLFDGSKYKRDKKRDEFSKKYNYFVSKQSDYVVVSKELTDEQYKTVFG